MAPTTLTATTITPRPGLFPGATTFPGAAVFPDKGDLLSATPL